VGRWSEKKNAKEREGVNVKRGGGDFFRESEDGTPLNRCAHYEGNGGMHAKRATTTTSHEISRQSDPGLGR